MRKELVSYIKTVLTNTGKFSTVCGLGSDKPKYPLVRVWVPGTPPQNLDNDPQARIDLRIAVQIETMLEKDAEGNTIDGPLYDLVDETFSALHGALPQGAGIQPFIVYDSPGLGEYASDSPAVYLMQVSARVIPEAFALT